MKGRSEPFVYAGLQGEESQSTGKAGGAQRLPWSCRREIYLLPADSPIQRKTERKRKKCWEKPSKWGERLSGAQNCPGTGRESGSPEALGRRGSGTILHQDWKTATKLQRFVCRQTWWKETALLEIFFLNEVPQQVYLYTFLCQRMKQGFQNKLYLIICGQSWNFVVPT